MPGQMPGYFYNGVRLEVNRSFRKIRKKQADKNHLECSDIFHQAGTRDIIAISHKRNHGTAENSYTAVFPECIKRKLPCIT